MNQPFPFAFPGPTALYLSLYVISLAAHVLFMSYVLAGSAYLGLRALRSHGPDRLEKTLQDWLPFAVGLAITAGVAPLLFVQILYEQRFYTANLLLFHRWMLIVPALIVGFYLLYLMKSGVAQQRRWLWRLTAVGAWGCFVFVAWSFTENHLLSRDQGAWVDTFASGSLIYKTPETIPRLLVWLSGATMITAPVLGWQLRGADQQRIAGDEARRLAWLALVGIGVAAIAAAVYLAVGNRGYVAVAASPIALPFTVVTLVGAAVQLGGWIVTLREREMRRGHLWTVTIGLIACLLGSGVVRESGRIAAVDMAALYPIHEQAFRAGGLGVFIVFALGNAVVIAYAIRLGRLASLREPLEDPAQGPGPA